MANPDSTNDKDLDKLANELSQVASDLHAALTLARHTLDSGVDEEILAGIQALMLKSGAEVDRIVVKLGGIPFAGEYEKWRA